VLVVEDDHLVAMEVEAVLVEAGFEVTGIASSADEAVKLASVRKPDLVIMDIRLTGVRDGIDAAIDLLTRESVRSIFATAHSDSATRERAQAASPLGWLSKPYQPQALVGAVRAAFAELDRSSGEGA
jgi:DNA-binding NarL/FixJ family response regulator